ncbi:MAG: 50S ribosomal protein L5 [Opitutales bacterium]|nr:50S ribosomal protein L5 [Opitutales bacterium]NRA26165.1 50S ribosomal protein L5 [Opitutales bacterium]
MSNEPTLKKAYRDTIAKELKEAQGYGNVHEVPSIEKIVINSGVKATDEKAVLQDIVRDIGVITCQKPVVTKARLSISNFKLREGMPIGCKVTLRGNRMYEFLYKFINLALPSIRDFRGVSHKLDGSGNYTFGVKDHTIFPEINVDGAKRTFGFDVTIVTSAKTDAEGFELLKRFGMPFRKQSNENSEEAA